jgi:hypothetical protein
MVFDNQFDTPWRVGFKNPVTGARAAGLHLAWSAVLA